MALFYGYIYLIYYQNFITLICLSVEINYMSEYFNRKLKICKKNCCFWKNEKNRFKIKHAKNGSWGATMVYCTSNVIRGLFITFFSL